MATPKFVPQLRAEIKVKSGLQQEPKHIALTLAPPAELPTIRSVDDDLKSELDDDVKIDEHDPRNSLSFGEREFIEANQPELVRVDSQRHWTCNACRSKVLLFKGCDFYRCGHCGKTGMVTLVVDKEDHSIPQGTIDSATGDNEVDSTMETLASSPPLPPTEALPTAKPPARPLSCTLPKTMR